MKGRQFYIRSHYQRGPGRGVSVGTAYDPRPWRATRTALIVDYGGVLTSDIFASFRAFCEAEGLAPEAVRERFREGPRGPRAVCSRSRPAS